MLIWTVKPVAVAVVLPNVGVNEAKGTVAVIVAEPLEYPVFAVVTVTVTLCPAPRDIEIKPVLLKEENNPSPPVFSAFHV